MSKTYLGDAVYAEADGYGGIMLTTEDGVSTTNSIYLEPEVIASFSKWMANGCRDWNTNMTPREELKTTEQE